MRSNRGFSLVEVLVASGILAIVVLILSAFLTYTMKSQATMERLMTAQGENLIASRQLWFDLESSFPSYNFISQPGEIRRDTPPVATITGPFFYDLKRSGCTRSDCVGPTHKLEKDNDQFVILYTDQRWKTSLMAIAPNFDPLTMTIRMKDLVDNITTAIGGKMALGKGLRGLLLHTAISYPTGAAGAHRFHQLLLEVIPDPDDKDKFSLEVVQRLLEGRQLFPNTHPLDSAIKVPSDEGNTKKSLEDFFKAIPTYGSNVAVYVRPVGGAIYSLKTPDPAKVIERGLRLVRRDLFAAIRGDPKISETLLATKVKDVIFTRPSETIRSVGVNLNFITEK